MTAGLLIICLALTSCGRKGIVHLSIADAQECQNLLMQEDALFSKAVAALAGVESQGAENSPENRAELLSVYQECRQYLDSSDQFVNKIYEKYGLSQEEYRLDVFGGAFMPLVK